MKVNRVKKILLSWVVEQNDKYQNYIGAKKVKCFKLLIKKKIHSDTDGGSWSMDIRQDSVLLLFLIKNKR